MKYIKEDKKSKVIDIVTIIVLLALIALEIMYMYGVFDVPVWKPVAEYPFTNQHITMAGATGRI